MEILKYRPMEKGKLKAFFTLKLSSGMEIRDLKLIDGPNGEFVGFPSREFTDKEGVKKYTNIVHIPDRERNNVFQEAVMKVLEPHRSGAAAQAEESGGEPVPF